jgi:hypothetical protein
MLHRLAGAAGVGALAAACGTRPAGSAVTLDDRIAALSDRLRPDQRYRGGTKGERRRAVSAVEHLLAGDVGAAESDFDELGFKVEHVRDAPAERDCVLARSELDTERAWGMLVLEPGTGPPDVLIEIPHPRADRWTEQIGLALFRALPGSALLIAGAHRRAADGAADVAHQRDSLFAGIADALGRRGSFQLQLHGYADDTLDGKDAVISNGKADVDARSKRVAESLDDAGLRLCRAWSGKCAPLEGLQNAQGGTASRRGLPFLHLELNHSTRADPERCSAVVAALAGGLRHLS